MLFPALWNIAIMASGSASSPNGLKAGGLILRLGENVGTMFSIRILSVLMQRARRHKFPVWQLVLCRRGDLQPFINLIYGLIGSFPGIVEEFLGKFLANIAFLLRMGQAVFYGSF
jgi:hypothetical protein